LDEVRLAEAGAAVDEERIEGTARIFGNRLRRRERELVRFADDECLEAIPRIEDGERKLDRWRRRTGGWASVGRRLGVGGEMGVDPVEGDFVESRATQLSVPLTNLLDELGGSAL